MRKCPIADSVSPIEVRAVVMAGVLPVLEANAMAEVAAFNCPCSTDTSPASVEVLMVLTTNIGPPVPGGVSSCPTEVEETVTTVLVVVGVITVVLPSVAISWSITDVPGVVMTGVCTGIGGGMSGL